MQLDFQRQIGPLTAAGSGAEPGGPARAKQHRRGNRRPSLQNKRKQNTKQERAKVRALRRKKRQRRLRLRYGTSECTNASCHNRPRRVQVARKHRRSVFKASVPIYVVHLVRPCVEWEASCWCWLGQTQNPSRLYLRRSA